MQSAIVARFSPPPKPPAGGKAGGAWEVISSFFTGRLRRKFYADADALSDTADVTRQVGAAYVCLAGAAGWIISGALVVIFNTPHMAAHLLAIGNAAGCYYGFRQLYLHRDPRPVMGVMIISAMLAVAAMSFQHSGILAPCLAALPVTIGLAAFYLQGALRRTAFVLGLAVVAFCWATSSGAIGLPSTYTTQGYAAMTFISLALAMVCLGGIAWIANLARDYAIGKLEAANARVLEASARSHVAMEAAKVGLWDVPDADLRKFHVSQSFETITGYTAEEFNDVFSRLHDFVHADDILALREAFGLGRKRLSRLRVDFRLMTKTRGYRWFSARARYSKTPDGSTRISGSLQDINFIKAAEEALRAGRDRAREANKAKSDFIAMMSHEVRTPLNAILGSVEVLKREEASPKSEELIELINDAGGALLAMVNDLLDVSKIEAGKIDVTPQPTDLANLVARTVEFWRPQASDKGVVLVVELSEADNRPVMVDPVRVRQIVGNLVSNAVKFTDEGKVTARLAMIDRPDGHCEAVVSVLDTGSGVPEPLREAIFAPFEQAPSGHARGGAGLGLFISRRLARMMEGDVTLEPAAAKGAHFRFSLAAERADRQERKAANPAAEPAWGARRVLVVDDNENNRRIAELLLDKFGLVVTTCASGAEALDLCGIESFHLILMDIVMPDMDGLETLRRLRSDETGRNRQTPTIALTAKLASEDVAAYAAAGFDGVAGKPINVHELAQAIAPFMVGGDEPGED